MRLSNFFTTIHKIRWLLSTKQKMQWLGLGVLSLISSGLEMVTAGTVVLFAQILSNPEAGPSYFDRFSGLSGSLTPQGAVLWAALLCGGAYMLKNSFLLAEVFYQNKTLQHMLTLFRMRLLTMYQKRSYLSFLSKSTTHRFEVIENNADQFFLLGMKSLVSGFSELMMAIVLFSLIFYMNAALAFYILTMTTGLMLILYLTIMSRFYHVGKQWQDVSLEARQKLLEFFHAFKEITLSSRADFFLGRYAAFSQQRAQTKAREATLGEVPKLILEATFVGMAVFAVWFLGIQQDNMQAIYPILGLYVYAGFRLIPTTIRLTGYGNHLALAKPFIDRLYEEIHADHTPHIEPKKTVLSSFKDSIQSHHLTFTYPGAQTKALDDVSLTITKGSCVGIVGTTGSGKSTLLHAILGLLMPQKGHVHIDNIPTHNIDWQNVLGYVPQAPYLLDASIADNVVFGDQNPDATRLTRAIHGAQLTRFVERQKQGLLTPIGEKGVRLSGGERQRIAIARALYHEPELLVLDEATSALDHHTERQLMKTIHTLLEGRTVIMVAHRLTTLSSCDQIFVMDNGRLKKTTTYEALSS